MTSRREFSNDRTNRPFLDKAARLSGYKSWDHAWREYNNFWISYKTLNKETPYVVWAIISHAISLKELGWKPPEDPAMVIMREVIATYEDEFGMPAAAKNIRANRLYPAMITPLITKARALGVVFPGDV